MKLKIFIVLFLVFLILPLYTNAQVNETQAQREARLKSELAQIEKEQAETEKILKETQGQSASLKRDIFILDTKIKVAQLNIKVKNLLIASLGKDIVKKQEKIISLEEKINQGRESLSQIIKKTNEVDSYTLAELILSKDSLSTTLSDLDRFESIQKSLKIVFEQIREDKVQTETEKTTLDKRKNSEEDARAIIQNEEKNIKNNQNEKQRLLTISKGNEKAYSQVLVEKRAKAAEIRAALFSLRDSVAIPFGDALKYAQEANKATGIRPAFLLAILTQESALGKNVGSCYLADTNTGSGVSVKSGSIISNVMNPRRDVPPFIDITKTLGMDPMKTLVSCPIPSAGGYGGAMGPAQFIASTWMRFKDRISNSIGISNPNPWNPEHAFIASSIYLTDLGAYSGSYTAERNAACRYYSGKSCGYSGNSSYGNQVMAKSDTIQRTMIDPLQGL